MTEESSLRSERYSIDEFIILLKEYDFKNNSVRKFANNYKVSEKTVIKYLKQNNIEYNSRTLIIKRNRDVNGRFCINITKHDRSFSFQRKSSISDSKSMDNERKTIGSNFIEKIKINPSKNPVKSEKSYEEKLRRIEMPFK
jgi:hypothetical protein